MIPRVWNEKSYKQFIDFLLYSKDEKYKQFHSSLVLNSRYKMIGIRVPIMKDIAKEIAKNSNIEDFLHFSQNMYYEEIMIQGLVISHIKDENIFYKYYKKHIQKIDNWALCDTFCSSIKIVRKFENKYFKETIEMSLSNEEFISRIGIVMILNHFVNETNLDTIFETLNKIKSDKFYINMAEAWLICELYIKYPIQTKEYLKNNNLSKFTQNKSISKIRDSYRISKEDKEYLIRLKK